MRDIVVAAVQFEPRDRDVAHNLATMRPLAAEAARQGAEMVVFHECCTTGYTFLQDLSYDELLALSEPVPAGPTVAALKQMAVDYGLAIGAGLLESSASEEHVERARIHNTYVVVDKDGNFVARHRKLHTFVSPHLSPGEGFTLFDLLGCRWGVLICYDNNLAENTRCTAMAGAEIILAPHVTGGTASPQPGRGTIDPRLWAARDCDPEPLRREFRSVKGREWVLRFLPCRAWENGVHYCFANNVGVDHDTIKPGGAMLIDACGNVLAECGALGDGIAVATLTAQSTAVSSGPRYLAARRPALYAPLVAANDGAATKPAWQRSWERADERSAADEEDGAAAAPTKRAKAA